MVKIQDIKLKGYLFTGSISVKDLTYALKNKLLAGNLPEDTFLKVEGALDVESDDDLFIVSITDCTIHNGHSYQDLKDFEYNYDEVCYALELLGDEDWRIDKLASAIDAAMDRYEDR